MKVSVATYRASTERLTALRQMSYGSSGSTESHRSSSLDSAVRNPSFGRRLQSVTFSGDYASPTDRFRLEECVNEAACEDDADDEKKRGEDQEEKIAAVSSLAMMVDGSPRRVHVSHTHDPSPQGGPGREVPRTGGRDHNPTRTDQNTKDRLDNEPVDMSHQDSSSTCSKTASTQSPLSGRSRWVKLRTTVQLSGAITHGHKRHPLKREDSFLKRFSTRQIPDSTSTFHGHSTGQGEIAHGTTSDRPWYVIFFTVINPDENALFVWLWVLTGCVLYNAWTLIARQAFLELQTSVSALWYTADAFTDLIFLLDIIVQLRTGYLEQGLMVCDTKKLAGHYLRSRSFMMDVASLTPLDFIQLRVGSIPLLRFPRFIKMYRSYRFYYIVESRTIYPNMWRVVNLIHILLLLAHWFGCFYYMLSEFEGFQKPGEGWAYHFPEGEYANLTRKYLASVYWSTLTLTTIGDLATPGSNLQYIFTIVSYLIGVFVFATIVGQVGNVITNRNASRLEFERLLDGAKLYMRHHRVPRNMQRRVQRWYDYSWSRGRMQGGGDINSALGSLPDKLKTELALHVNLKTLKKVTIFQECQPEFLHDLVLKMKAYIFTPGDLICRKGEVAREMFIIADGILEVISETGKVLTQMKAGDFFGEIGILNLDGFNRRTADVRSVGYAELFSLSREDVLSAMKDYPEAQEILQTMGRKRLMEARLAAAAAKKQEDTSSLSTPTSLRANSTTEPPREGSGKESRIRLKLKQDVLNLHKLLKRHSAATDSKRNRSLGTHLEMATLEREKSRESPSFERQTTLRGNGPSDEGSGRFHKLISRINSKSGSNASPTFKGLIQKIPCIGSEVPATEAHHSGSVSSRSRLLSFADSTASGSSGQPAVSKRPIGEGLPLLERIKLLRQIEIAKNAPEAPINPLRISESLPQQPRTSPLPHHGAEFNYGLKRKTSDHGERTVCNNPKLPSSVDNAGSPLDKSLPLIKRVLMLKAKEESDKMTSHDSPSSCINNSTTEEKSAQEATPRVVRPNTLGTSKGGFGTQEISTSGGSSSLQSSSFDSSGQASVICAPSELWKVPTLEGYAARRARFIRMAAFDEKQVDDSDSSSASTPSEVSKHHRGCQTEEPRDAETSDEVPGGRVTEENNAEEEEEGEERKPGRSLDHSQDEEDPEPPHQKKRRPKNSRNSRRSSSTEIVLEKYFTRVMKCMKHVLKTYLEETQVDLHRKIQELQNEVNHKSALIGQLEEALKGQEYRASSGLEEISSLSSNMNSDTEESETYEMPFMKSESCESEDARQDFASFVHSKSSEQCQKTSSHRYSWPSGLSLIARRQKARPNRQPLSLDEENLLESSELELKPEDLWRVEFPPNSDIRDPLDLSATANSLLNPYLATHRVTPCSPNDWEIQMLVEQFNRQVQESSPRKGRRHSVGDYLTGNQAPASKESDTTQQEGTTKSKPFRRKFSLRDDRLLNRWLPHRKQSRLSTSRRRSLPHFPGKSDFKVLEHKADIPKGKSMTSSLENLTYSSLPTSSASSRLSRTRRNTFCTLSSASPLSPQDSFACSSEKASSSSPNSPLTPSPERFQHPHDEVRMSVTSRLSPVTPETYKKEPHSFLPTISEDDSARHPSIKLLKTIYSESCSLDHDPAVAQDAMVSQLETTPVVQEEPTDEGVVPRDDEVTTPTQENSVVIVIPENEPLLTTP